MTPEADTAGLTSSAAPGAVDEVSRAKARSAAAQAWVKQLDMRFSLDCVSARWGERGRWDRLGVQGEPRGERGAERKREADAGDGGRPADPIEDLAQHGAAGETTQEVAGEIEPARRAAIGRGGATDEAGGRRLGKEGTDGKQREP